MTEKPAPERESCACRHECEDGKHITCSPDELTAAYTPLARGIARRIHDTLPSPGVHEFDDLLQAGLLGLFLAARQYRAEHGVAFPVYARYRIRGEILDSLRRADVAPRSLRQKKRAHDAATTRPVDAPDLTEPEGTAAGGFHPSQDEIQKLARDLHTVYQLTYGSGDIDPEAVQAIEANGTQAPLPDRLVESDQIRSILRGALDGLPPRQREIVVLYYFHGKSMKEIGQQLGLHTSRVHQLRKHSLQELGARLREKGIQSPMEIGFDGLSLGQHDES